MATLAFVRFDNKILDMATGKVETFESISKAKRWSRLHQGNTQGNGTIRVATSKYFFAKAMKEAKAS